MNAHNVSFSDINDALSKENVELPAGKIYGNNTELTIRTLGRLTTEDQFNKLIIKENTEGDSSFGRRFQS